MNKRIIKNVCLVSALAGAMTVSAYGQVLLFEDFEDATAFDANWSQSGDGPSFLAEAPDDANNQTLYSEGGLQTRSFTGHTPTDQEWIRIAFRYYDTMDALDVAFGDPGDTGRDYFDIRNAGDVTSLINLGLHNSAAGNADDEYTFRVFGYEGNAWLDTGLTRSEGWHEFEIHLFGESLDMYHNGSAFQEDIPYTVGEFSIARLGFGFGAVDGASHTGVHYDDLTIEVIPEPSTYAAIFGGLALAGAFVMRRRRRSVK